MWTAWRPVLPSLQARHEVLALTLPGHDGGPDLSHCPVTIATLADQIEGLLDRAGVGSAHVAGSSLGGWLTLELARRGRTLSATALAPVGLLDADEVRRLTARLRSEQATARRLLPVARLFARTAAGRALLFRGTLHRPAALPGPEAVRLLDAYAACPAFDAFVDGLEHDVPPPLPARFPCPVCVAWPNDDRMTPAKPHAARFAAALPGATHVRLPAAGHLPMSDVPELVADVILACTGRARPGVSP